MVRLLPRRTFTSRSRQPAVSFFTSSFAKYVQAKLVFEASGLSLTHRRHDDEPYHESYDGTKEELLTEAVREIRGRGAATGSLFFIEDTSIQIDDLSQNGEYPGLAAKEWFDRTTFEELDAKLRINGNRAATVHSCIALAVPDLERPIFFYGKTLGKVASQPAKFSPDPLYPWLVPNNFSAWFIPDGSSITLSEMSFEASLKYDFRVRSLTALIDRLEEYAVVLNAVPSMYSKMPPSKKEQAGGYLQNELFPEVAKPVYLIIGPTCAGKSTFGNYAQENTECQVIDASSVVRAIRDERQQDDVPIGEFASELLEREGPDIVARYIERNFSSAEERKTLVVTGFRAIEEVEYFRDVYASVTVVSVEAPPRVRYERYIRRGSREAINSFTEFREHDAEQYSLGLLNVASELADTRIFNHLSREVYYQQIAVALGINSDDAMGIVRVGHHLSPGTSQLYRCLVILRSAGRPLTTQEIEKAFPGGRFVRYNNANKMLKRYPELARRQEGHGSNVRYQITQSGLTFLAAIDRLNRNGG
jgi:inosine/xanthosine triphosphate pyrophosphatase family protein/dephospho-CoA kinase